MDIVKLSGLGRPPAMDRRGGLEAWRTRAGEEAGPPRMGEGRRMIRLLQKSGQCCLSPALNTEGETGQNFCSSCLAWWSASHTPGCLAVARCSLPVGIDVQRHVHRPAALRWLARTTEATFQPSIGHWAVAEAYWKASGNARRRPAPGEFGLPRVPGTGWGKHAFDGTTECDYWLQEVDGISLALVLGPAPAIEGRRRSPIH